MLPTARYPCETFLRSSVLYAKPQEDESHKLVRIKSRYPARQKLAEDLFFAALSFIRHGDSWKLEKAGDDVRDCSDPDVS